MKPSEYDEITPYQLNIMVKDYKRKRNQEEKNSVTLVWLAEALHRKQRLPQLEQLLKEEKPKKRMTDSEMLEQVKKLNALFGGEVQEGGNS